MPSCNRLAWIQRQVAMGREVVVSFSHNAASNAEKIKCVVKASDDAVKARPVLQSTLTSLRLALDNYIVTDKGHKSKTTGYSIVEFWIKPHTSSGPCIVHADSDNGEDEENKHEKEQDAARYCCKTLLASMAQSLDVLSTKMASLVGSFPNSGEANAAAVTEPSVIDEVLIELFNAPSIIWQYAEATTIGVPAPIGYVGSGTAPMSHADILQEITIHDIHDTSGIELVIEDAHQFITHTATSSQAVAIYRALEAFFPAHERASLWRDMIDTDEEFCEFCTTVSWTNSEVLQRITNHDIDDTGDMELVIEDAQQLIMYTASPSQAVAIYRALAAFYPTHENANVWRAKA